MIGDEEAQEQRALQGIDLPQSPVAQGSTGIRQMAAEYAPAALDALSQIVTRGISESARVSAAVALLDRAYGKPAQAITGEDGGPIEMSVVSRLGGLSYLELKALITEPEKLG